jgi:hypothetical protein
MPFASTASSRRSVQFALAAGRISLPQELGNIDKGFDYQHRWP